MSRLTVKDAVSGKDINNLLEANNENQTGAADAYMLAIGGKRICNIRKNEKNGKNEEKNTIDGKRSIRLKFLH